MRWNELKDLEECEELSRVIFKYFMRNKMN